MLFASSSTAQCAPYVPGRSQTAPKKKKSKSKRNQRHAVWKGKAALAAQKAISLGKSVLTGKAQGFVYPIEEEEEEE